MFHKIGVTSVLCAVLMAGTAVSPAFAQEDAREFSQITGDVVNKTMQLAAEENYEAALKALRALIGKDDLKAFERATIYQMIGQYSYELDRMGDAQRAFENAIKSGGLLPDDVDNMNVVIAQLMIANGQFREGAERLETYLTSGGEKKPQYVELLVNGWVQAEDYARALPWAKKWIDAAEPKQRKHYDLLSFLYHTLDKEDDQLRLIKEMIDRWPEDRGLWNGWLAVLISSGQEAEAFEVYKIMYQAGLLTTEKDLLKVVQYYDFYDMPFEAAKLLEREIEAGRISDTPGNLKKTASLFSQAREAERAIPFLEAAAKWSDDRALTIDLAVAFSESGACEKSEAAFETAINRGYDRGKAQMLIGSCYADQYRNLNRPGCHLTDALRQKAPFTISRTAALDAFKAVSKNSRESGNARRWTQFIETEIKADERRCRHDGRNVERELCYQKIKHAYDAAIFTNGFQLDDKSCEKYVVYYNEEFRVSAPSK